MQGSLVEKLFTVFLTSFITAACATFPTHSAFDLSRYSIITACYEGPPLQFVLDEHSRQWKFFQQPSGIVTNWRFNRFNIGKAFERYLFQVGAFMNDDVTTEPVTIRVKLVDVSLRYTFSFHQMVRLLARDAVQAVTYVDTVSLFFPIPT